MTDEQPTVPAHEEPPTLIDDMQSGRLDQLFAALALAQGKISGAKKDQENPHFKAKFAGLSSTWDACREALSENGLAIVQTMRITPEGYVLRTTLGHKSGQWIRGDTPLLMERQGMQPLGSAVTYARRYGVQSMTGIAPVDDDGEGATVHHGKDEPVIGELGKVKLQNKMREFDKDLQAIEDEDALAGLLESYKDALNQCERDLPSWYYTKAGSDVQGIKDRIAVKEMKFRRDAEQNILAAG